MQVLGILQARMGAKRLPGKMLLNLGKHTVLGYLLEELRGSLRLDQLVVATTIAPSDDPIAEFCAKERVYCYRGSIEDVLSRFANLANYFCPDHIVRLTGDNPLLPSSIVDLVIEAHVLAKKDYTFTGAYFSDERATFPDGWDVEAMTRTALLSISEQATEPFDREHVSRYLLQHPEQFTIQSVKAPQGFRFPQVGLTLDQPQDLLRIRVYYEWLETGKTDRLRLPQWIVDHPDDISVEQSK